MKSLAMQAIEDLETELSDTLQQRNNVERENRKLDIQIAIAKLDNARLSEELTQLKVDLDWRNDCNFILTENLQQEIEDLKIENVTLKTQGGRNG